MRRLTLVTILSALLAGCTSLGTSVPDTLGARFSGYGYVPLDPLPIIAVAGQGCANNTISGELLRALPDNAVRIAIRQTSGQGSLTLGPAAVGVKGNSYEVILDYVNVDVTNIPFIYTSSTSQQAANLPLAVPSISLIQRNDGVAALQNLASNQGAFVVPVYVGVGLRLTANVTVRKGEVNLGSLGALAAAAQAEDINGSMIVQTLGITGSQVISSLPLPSELNPTTIQNAILALGSVKAVVGDTENTFLTARVTGIYNPLGVTDQRIINMIVSELASTPVTWSRSCNP